MREITVDGVFVRFVPAIPGVRRQHVEIVNGRHVLCSLAARNIQRALALPEDGESEPVEVEMTLRRKGDK